MILSAHQPLYWGYLGTLHKQEVAHAWVEWDAVQAEDSGFENRTRILSRPTPYRTGDAQWLTVPVHKERARTIRETRIVQTQGWQRKHFRTLANVYKGAPYWEEHAPFLEQLYLRERWEWLADLNGAIRVYLAACFRVVRPSRSQTDMGALDIDSLDHFKTSCGAIVAVCRALGADAYVFGPLGRDYAESAAMRAAGVRPLFQEYSAVGYPQGTPDLQQVFIPNLCPLDALFWLGRDGAREAMLGGGTVVSEAA